MTEPRDRPLDGPVVELLAERLAILCQPLRIRMIDLLDLHGELTVGELADELGASQQNVSNHLARLAGAGIVHGRRDGREVRYRLVAPDVFAVYRVTSRTLLHGRSRTAATGCDRGEPCAT